MIILIVFAFLAGIVTLLSPCILPVLPIVLSSSVKAGKRRPLGVVTGFVVSFTFFTLFVSSLVQLLGISAEALRIVAVVVIGFFGLSLLVPQLQEIFERAANSFSRFTPQQTGGDFWSGLVVGISLGLIWTPCVGPILAAVIALAATSSVSSTAVLITLAYALGTAVPMFAIMYGGRQALQRVPWLTNNTRKIQQAFGVLMIVVAGAIYFNLDRQFQTWVLTTFPEYGTGLTQLEDIPLVRNQLGKQFETNQPMPERGQPMFEVQQNYPRAPELVGGTGWINSEPLLIHQDLEGQVVLVDFWTYSCINCIRTFPYLTEWYEKYQDDGFVIIGVHSPEFEFEKDRQNVIEAMEDYGLTYPVVQDNDFNIWRAYNNRYWPAHYLIDKQGRIRYTHFGEGQYQQTENKIRELLGEENLEEPMSNKEDTSTPDRRQTPETYLGYGRAEAYTLENDINRDQVATYEYAGPLPLHVVGLQGQWTVGEENTTAAADGAQLGLHFLAETVHLVMGAAETPATVQVLLDGQPVPEQYWTDDINENGEIVIDGHRKYDLVDVGDDYGQYQLELIFSQGVEAYAFTFSS